MRLNNTYRIRGILGENTEHLWVIEVLSPLEQRWDKIRNHHGRYHVFDTFQQAEDTIEHLKTTKEYRG